MLEIVFKLQIDGVAVDGRVLALRHIADREHVRPARNDLEIGPQQRTVQRARDLAEAAAQSVYNLTI